MNAHNFINNSLGFDINNPYILIEKYMIGMLDERVDATNITSSSLSAS